MEKRRDTSQGRGGGIKGTNATLMKYLNNRMDQFQSQMGFNQTMKPDAVNLILSSTTTATLAQNKTGVFGRLSKITESNSQSTNKLSSRKSSARSSDNS